MGLYRVHIRFGLEPLPKTICIPHFTMTNRIVKKMLAPVRHAMVALYILLYAVLYAAIIAVIWCGKGCAKLVRGYFRFAYQWQPKYRGKPPYDVTPAFDAGVTASMLLMAGVYAFLAM